jgi:hypothetical protein
MIGGLTRRIRHDERRAVPTFVVGDAVRYLPLEEAAPPHQQAGAVAGLHRGRIAGGALADLVLRPGHRRPDW